MILVFYDIDKAIYLSDRIIVLFDRLGRFKKVIDVSLSCPQERSDPRSMES